MKRVNELIRSMRRDTVDNYIVPGLASSLIGGDGVGKVRLFESARSHDGPIAPHSHRFDFVCYVLEGRVHQTIWVPGDHGDEFFQQRLVYDGDMGQYKLANNIRKKEAIQRWAPNTNSYTEGQWYTMKSHQIHTITFSRGAMVLFFEGPEVSNSSQMLLPYVNGKVIHNADVQPWMFERRAKP